MKGSLISLLMVVSLLMAVLLPGCAPSTRVTRIESTTPTDLSGRWNDTDSRLVADEMIRDVLMRPWLKEHVAQTAQKPAVIVGQIRNLSSEHISTETFIKDIERELINSGQVRIVAARDERRGVRDERFEQQHFASEASMKAWAKELGADYMLIGSIKTITDAIEGKQVVYYQTDLELVQIESTEKVWIGSKKIKKVIERDKVRW
ncbi:MAG: penicillin-binding protein activator LpoB [candidate division KSB1 bacterium]|nr:penicillin-binding protein activator LpoB [candidate division KSB1 bacterium]MDZ7304116.1 penicillin-binding protein activator LpoB [candidate division KSB1 bacterium]MDZ7313387.1 penicillin-binding protein activator LpoB [candidate division KSB1 bacterium]